MGGLAAVGVALGGAALFNSLAARRTERDNPPRGHFATVGGVRLHYLDRGAGRPILLLHGNGASSAELEASGIVARLALSNRVIVPDRPGYGYSDRPRGTLWTPERQAEILGELLATLDVQDAVVVGHSWGTLVAVALALAEPKRVKALLLVSGYYYPSARLDVPFLSGPAVPVVGDLLAQTVAPLVARAILPALLGKMFRPLPVDRRFLARYPLAMSFRPEQIRASAEETAYMIPAAGALSRRYGELELPIVIMAGECDRIVDTRRQSVRLHGELPTSALALVPGVGHMVQYAECEAIARAAEALAAS